MTVITSGFLTVASGIVSVFFALLLLFQTLRLPVVSVVSLITEPRTVRLSRTMLIITAVTLLLLLCKPTAARYVIFIFSVVGLLCALLAAICNFLIASRHKADISPAVALSGEKDKAAADVEIDSYTRFEDSDIGLSLWKPHGADAGAPVLVYIHGGAWMNDNRFLNGDMHHCLWFSQNGCLTASVDYPLAAKDRPMYAHQENTIVRAIAWLRDHAADFGGDTRRFYLTGGSAGGNLALNLAARINKGEFAGLLGPDFRVAAVSVLFPATNITDLYNEAPAPLAPLLRSACKANWGGTPDEVPERYRQNSSDRLADENMAPVFTVYGKNDHMVPGATVKRYLARLDALGVENRSVVFPFADHLCDTSGSIEAQTWRSMTLRWFREHE